MVHKRLKYATGRIRASSRLHTRPSAGAYVGGLVFAVVLPGNVFWPRRRRWPGGWRAVLLALVDVHVLVQTVDQYPAGVTADVRDADHGGDGPVAAPQHGEWKRHDEHALRTETTINFSAHRYEAKE